MNHHSLRGHATSGRAAWMLDAITLGDGGRGLVTAVLW